MNAGLVAWSAAAACIGSLITGYTLKLIEHRREARYAGPLEVNRKRHIDRYEAVKQIHGMARGLHHSVLHPSRMSTDPDMIREIAPVMRKTARSNVEVLGERYVRAVMDLTDVALSIADSVDASRKVDASRRYEPGPIQALRFDDAFHALNREGVELLS